LSISVLFTISNNNKYSQKKLFIEVYTFLQRIPYLLTIFSISVMKISIPILKISNLVTNFLRSCGKIGHSCASFTLSCGAGDTEIPAGSLKVPQECQIFSRKPILSRRNE